MFRRGQRRPDRDAIGGTPGKDVVGVLVVGVGAVLFVGILVAVLGAVFFGDEGETVEESSWAEKPSDELSYTGFPITFKAEGRPFITVTNGDDGYGELRQRFGEGSHEVDVTKWEEVMEVLGWEFTPEERVRATRWAKQWSHWDNVEAIEEDIESFRADGRIDADDVVYLCAHHGSWQAQLKSARDYVRDFRQIDPDKVAAVPGLQRLEERAVTLLDLIEEAEAACG